MRSISSGNVLPARLCREPQRKVTSLNHQSPTKPPPDTEEKGEERERTREYPSLVSLVFVTCSDSEL